MLRVTTRWAEDREDLLNWEGLMWKLVAGGVVVLGLGAAVVMAGPGQHSVAVTLNYDFSVDNACSSSVTTGCVKQFNIYDISGGGTPVK